MIRMIVLVIVACVWSPFIRAVERPNVVIIMCDDLGYGDLGCFGNSAIMSVHINALAEEGIKFTSCYSAAPVCSPSRAGLMTGRTPNRLGIFDWIPENSGIYLRAKEVTIAHLLKHAGYKTCHVGKWHLNSKTDGSESTPGDAGFDHSFYTQNNALPNHMEIRNFIRNGKQVESKTGPASHVVVDEATNWLREQNAQQPFFLNVWFHEPHEPVVARDDYLALYEHEENIDRRHYFGDVTQMDAAVGKLLRYLKDNKLSDNTIVIFTSDNGPETLNRYKSANRSYGSPGSLRGMKLHVTEAGYRVPGIIRWPGKVTPNSVSDVPISTLDFLPTLCAAVGIAAPADRTLDGANILPLFAGEVIKRPQPLYWQYNRALSSPWQIALRDGAWKLLANTTLDAFVLYNLDEDIAETRDRASEEPVRVQQMIAELKRIHAEVAVDAEKSGNPKLGAGKVKKE